MRINVMCGCKIPACKEGAHQFEPLTRPENNRSGMCVDKCSKCELEIEFDTSD
jgi:hypothetical protein